MIRFGRIPASVPSPVNGVHGVIGVYALSVEVSVRTLARRFAFSWIISKYFKYRNSNKRMFDCNWIINLQWILVWVSDYLYDNLRHEKYCHLHLCQILWHIMSCLAPAESPRNNLSNVATALVVHCRLVFQRSWSDYVRLLWIELLKARVRQSLKGLKIPMWPEATDTALSREC